MHLGNLAKPGPWAAMVEVTEELLCKTYMMTRDTWDGGRIEPFM